MKIAPHQKQGYELMHRGLLALSRVEANGIRIDVRKLEATEEDLTLRLRDLRKKLTDDPVWKMWRKRFGEKANLLSGPQTAEIFYKQLGFKPTEFTDSGAASTDEEALQKIDHPFIPDFVRVKKYDKALGTFLRGIKKETVDGFLHPFFNLHLARSMRSCVAKGTRIEVMRDLSKQPLGIPIEDVKAGDYVYCYDGNLRLTVKKVIWAGRTGHREVLRVHWRACGRRGFLDVTPEHKIRLASGIYVKARQLVGDWRQPGTHNHAPKISVLAMHRDAARPDMIYETGTRGRLHDARVIYASLVGTLGSDDVIHHKDLNHFNNSSVNNLQKKSKSKHARDHALAGDFWTDDERKRGSLVGNAIRKKKGYLTGPENPLWKHITKFSFLRMMSKAGGRSTYGLFDFGVLKNKAHFFRIDLGVIRDRYDKSGNYISRGKILRAFDGKTASIHKAFDVNYEKARRLLGQRGLGGLAIREISNPCGRRGKPNNHSITRIEWIKKTVDVYDLQVEDCHNFIANEICVHNSSDSPNFQNFPVRDKEIAKIIRSLFIPRKGCALVENDFKGVEVSISATCHHDPNFISYITTPGKDMHRDMAAQIYMLKPNEVSKEARYGAKNKFVFPQFYGDYYVACARNLWDWITKGNLTGPGGIPLMDHLRQRGIKRLGDCDPEREPERGTFEAHLKAVEDDFWNNRFRGYGQWKRDNYDAYLKTGYVDLHTGFRVHGILRRNQVNNMPVQGPAFHCLLQTLIWTQDAIDHNRWESKIVGQIHDSLLTDVRISELADYQSEVEYNATQRLREEWKWLIVPLEIEYEIAPSDGSWHDKRDVKFKLGRFRHPSNPDLSTTDSEKFMDALNQAAKMPKK